MKGVKGLLLLGCFVVLNVQSLPEDRELPIRVVSKSLSYDRQSSSIFYEGDVIITQGNLILKGQKVEVIQHDQGGVHKIMAHGEPAYFKDIIEKEQPPTIATGQYMEYQSDKRILYIQGNAKVIRGEDQFMGHQIHYLLDESKLAATGGDVIDGEEQHIEMIIQPRTLKP